MAAWTYMLQFFHVDQSIINSKTSTVIYKYIYKQFKLSRTLIERLNCVKQLVFARTRLEFRLIWNKLFQKEDEELGWLLNPHKSYDNATPMTTFARNFDSDSYHYDDAKASLEGVTIHNQSVTKKTHSKKEKKSFYDTAIQVARYMGMGVYMTSTAFPSPLRPIPDGHYYDEYYDEHYYGLNSVHGMKYAVW